MALQEVHVGSEAHGPVLEDRRRLRWPLVTESPAAEFWRRLCLQTDAGQFAASDKGSMKAPLNRIVLRSHMLLELLASLIWIGVAVRTVAAAATALVAELEAPGRRGGLVSRRVLFADSPPATYARKNSGDIKSFFIYHI